MVGTGLFERDRREAERVLAPFVEVHELGKQRYFGPEHKPTVERLRARGWKVPFDEFDSEGNTIAGPNFEPEEDYGDGDWDDE